MGLFRPGAKHGTASTDGESAAAADGVVPTGSISSTVDLDFGRDEAHKVYHPSFPVRLLYRLVFQAPFPYAANHAALEAARQRRLIVDRLTQFWFGHHLVAEVLGVEDTPAGGHDFVTRLVEGTAPRDKKLVTSFLRQLDRRFLEAGPPTWQVAPYSPHSVTNLIEREDGTYRIIDLESSLVAHLQPVSHIVGLIRAGIFPSFDDIEAERLAAYVSRNAAALDASLGDEYPALLEAIEAYRSSADAWHASEPRLVNRMLRGRLRLVDVPTWLRSFRSLLQSSERRVEALVLKGADEWVADGRLEAGAPERLIVTLRSPEVAYAVAHLGVHFALSVPLRFPFGSLARFLYTAALRLRAGVQRRTDGERSRGGRCSQTIPVALFALLPGVGRLAYLLSPALASNRLLLVSPSDYLARRLPFRLYGRLHLDALFLFWGRELSPASAPERGSSAPARPSFSPPAA